jgi:AhpD family alkylhydroperoxidase
MSKVLEPRTVELVGIAAAVAGHCEPCFEFHYRKAIELGVGHGEIQAALTLARSARAAGDRHMGEFVTRREAAVAVEVRAK